MTRRDPKGHQKVHHVMHSTFKSQSDRGNKNINAEFSRISSGGSMSEISICSIDFDMSSTENGILHFKKSSRQIKKNVILKRIACREGSEREINNLESSSSKNELLTALLESSVINILIFDIT